MNGLPQIGDRVHIEGRSETYVVVAVDGETQSVSVIPESEVLQSLIDELIPEDETRSKD